MALILLSMRSFSSQPHLLLFSIYSLTVFIFPLKFSSIQLIFICTDFSHYRPLSQLHSRTTTLLSPSSLQFCTRTNGRYYSLDSSFICIYSRQLRRKDSISSCQRAAVSTRRISSSSLSMSMSRTLSLSSADVSRSNVSLQSCCIYTQMPTNNLPTKSTIYYYFEPSRSPLAFSLAPISDAPAKHIHSSRTCLFAIKMSAGDRTRLIPWSLILATSNQTKVFFAACHFQRGPEKTKQLSIFLRQLSGILETTWAKISAKFSSQALALPNILCRQFIFIAFPSQVTSYFLSIFLLLQTNHFSSGLASESTYLTDYSKICRIPMFAHLIPIFTGYPQKMGMKTVSLKPEWMTRPLLLPVKQRGMHSAARN